MTIQNRRFAMWGLFFLIAISGASHAREIVNLALGEAAKEVPLQPVAKDQMSVADFGARGDGVSDDTTALQAALNFCFSHNVHTLSFVAGKTYLMSSGRSQNSLTIYGNNLVVNGNGSTIIARNPVSGYFGAVFDIAGPINGKIYPIIGRYTGATRVAKGIVVENFTIRHETAPKYMNTIGIHNVDGVTISNVKIIESPQTGIAIVADSKYTPVSNVVLKNCEVDNSGSHSFRINLNGSADTLTVLMDHCVSKGVRGPETLKEIKGEHVQVWYRAAGHGGAVGLRIINSHFDSSGVILANMGSRNLVLENNIIEGGVVLRSGRRNDPGFHMSGNKLGASGVEDHRLKPVN